MGVSLRFGNAFLKRRLFILLHGYLIIKEVLQESPKVKVGLMGVRIQRISRISE
jgi:hypothetical protein